MRESFRRAVPSRKRSAWPLAASADPASFRSGHNSSAPSSTVPVKSVSLRRLLVALPCLAVAASASAQRFEVVVSPKAQAKPITGRVYVAISRDVSRQTPIAQGGETGSPVFAVDVTAFAPGSTAVIDASAFGHPVQSLRDLPRGEYWVQPFVNVYTRFARADGHTVWMHMDQWEGQNWRRSPGNLYGDPVRITWDPRASTPIRLVADHVIPPVVVPNDNQYVRRIKK